MYYETINDRKLTMYYETTNQTPRLRCFSSDHDRPAYPPGTMGGQIAPPQFPVGKPDDRGRTEAIGVGRKTSGSDGRHRGRTKDIGVDDDDPTLFLVVLAGVWPLLGPLPFP